MRGNMEKEKMLEIMRKLDFYCNRFLDLLDEYEEEKKM